MEARTRETYTYYLNKHILPVAVAQVAHQIGLHGIVTPAATDMGETFALLTDLLPADQRSTRSAPDTAWEQLPADPRSALPRHLIAMKS
jgi:hypothetical protein